MIWSSKAKTGFPSAGREVPFSGRKEINMKTEYLESKLGISFENSDEFFGETPEETTVHDLTDEEIEVMMKWQRS